MITWIVLKASSSAGGEGCTVVRIQLWKQLDEAHQTVARLRGEVALLQAHSQAPTPRLANGGNSAAAVNGANGVNGVATVGAAGGTDRGVF